MKTKEESTKRSPKIYSHMINILFVFLASIPFGYRIILKQWTLGFDEYETAFFYVSDILMLMFFLMVFLSYKKTIVLKHITIPKTILVFVFFAAVSVVFSPLKLLAIYNFLRLIFLVVMAFILAMFLEKQDVKSAKIFSIFASIAIIESLVGLIQFLLQRSLGLYWLGEPLLNHGINGVAKINADGAEILRAYGTFPHPNILGAFLLLGLFSTYFFWLRRPSERKIWSGVNTLKSDLFFGVGIFIIILGLIITFSRSAWIIGLVGTFLLCLGLFFSKFRIQATRLLILVSATSIISIIVFKPFIFPRAQISMREPAISYRVSYNELGIDLIKKNPLGVGLGNQVIYSVKNSVYSNFGMNFLWEWQPIHNIYILAAAEIGIIGLLAFVIFICGILGRGILFGSGSITTLEAIISKTQLFSLFVFGFVDHFLWTIQPGRLMLWVVIGMVMGVSGLNLSKNNKNI